MKKMWEYLKNDEELQQLRKEWKEKFKESFPPWNYDCFGGPDEYKRRIKAALEVFKCYIFFDKGQKCKQLKILKLYSIKIDFETGTFG